VIAELVPALAMGVAGGAHCITMCGGVASSVCGTGRDPSLRGRAAYSLAWNAGRVATYAALGAIAGAIGAVPLTLVPLEMARLALRAVAAVLLLGLGLHLAGVTSLFTRVEALGVPLWARVAPLARRLLPVRSSAHAALLGAAWGFVPCGLVYAALSLALGAGSLAQGALTMLAFGLGTLPVMAVLTTILADLARRLATGWGRRVAGAFIVVLAAHQAWAVASAVDLGEALSLGTRPHACCHPRAP
jgi:sulfite exporter TauE/SafE